MRMLAIAGVIAAMLALGGSAQAQGQYWPWCARYFDGWTVVCGFASFGQCMATVSGVGGLCEPNVMGPAPGEVYTPRKRKRGHR